MLRSSALVLSALLFTTLPAAAATVIATASLDGAQAGTPSAATGSATFTFDDVSGDYSVSLDVDGIDAFEINAAIAGGIHIHSGAPGVAGPIVLNIANDRTGLSIPAFGMFSFLAEGVISDVANIAALLAAGELYLNVHTEEFSGGEIRGQFAVIPVPGAVLLLGSALIGLVGIGRRTRA